MSGILREKERERQDEEHNLLSHIYIYKIECVYQ